MNKETIIQILSSINKMQIGLVELQAVAHSIQHENPELSLEVAEAIIACNEKLGLLLQSVNKVLKP